MASDQERFVSIDHPRIRRVEKDVFHLRFVRDCMRHACRCEDEGGRFLPDACCQHGADVDLFERDRIVAHADVIARVLRPEFRDPSRWFDASQPEPAPEFPSGVVIRTGLAGDHDASGCVFLQHDGRGCAIHRAALEHGLAPAALKPAICQLYPLTIYGDTLGFSDDFDRYSCGRQAGGPSVYRVMRPTLAARFGEPFVVALDRAERQLRRGRLAIVAYG